MSPRRTTARTLDRDARGGRARTLGGCRSRAAAPAGGAESDAATTEQTSAILVQPIHDAQVVRGDDGKEHVEYELMVVNVFSDPVTLTSVTVLDPAGKELARIDGATLAAATQALLTKAPAPVVNPSAAVAVDVDLALKPGTVPKRVTHRIDYTLPDPQHAVIVDIGDTVVHGPEVAIERRAPIVLAAPLAGDGWMASSGCCAPNVHRDTPPRDQRRPHRDVRDLRRSTGRASRTNGSTTGTAHRTSSTTRSEPTCSPSPTRPSSRSRTVSPSSCRT